MKGFLDALGAVVVGYRFHHGLDHTVDERRLLLAIGITHYRPPGAARAQFVVVVVFVDSGAGAI